jgi:phosphate transport system substrate-binding protein
MVGKTLLHYRIVAKLGAGGQGEVYKAINTKLNRIVVLKVLPREMTVSGVNLKRFEREARLASSLDHPNICAIYDLAFHDELHFIVMQHVEGFNVRELVNGRPLDLKSALSIAIQVCDALVAAHNRGIIHRDIKANNVMVTKDGQVKILDFGLAKLLNERAESQKDIHQTHLTEVGVPYGTATYAAPEQALGLRVDARADIFSTGVLLYEMLTGKWPFEGKTVIDVRYALLHDTPRPLAEARPNPVPPMLQNILDRALAKNADDRYQKVMELRDDLRKVLHDLSVADDPQFKEELEPFAPRYLSRPGVVTRSLDSISFRTGINKRVVTIGVAAVVILVLIPLLVLFLSRRQSSGSTLTFALRLHGSNTIGTRLAPSLVEEFLRKQGATEVRTVNGASPDEAIVSGVLPGHTTATTIDISSHGSSTAFVDLLNGNADIGLSSRKINATEIRNLAAFGDMTSSASEHILGLDGIAVIVNRDNPIDSLTREQVAQLFSGEITKWNQVQSLRGEVKVYARDDKSGTFDSFKALVLGNKQLVARAMRFEDSIALSDAVARDPDGIGFIGLPFIRDAKAVAISEGSVPPLLPSSLTVGTEDYLLSRRLFLYTKSTSENPWIAKFIEFALSNEGQRIVGDNGFIAQTVQAESASVAAKAPAEYRRLTQGAERLSLNLRFRKGGKDLDNKARLDLDRVVNFITDLKFTGQNILLFGFADDESGNDVNLALSKDRAELVAEQFKRRGLVPLVVTGFGDSIPVASSLTEEGKEKNRRVELWLKK